MKLSKTKIALAAVSITVALATTGCMSGKHANHNHSKMEQYDKAHSITGTYADIAIANYTDALNDAKALEKAINTFAVNPTDTTLGATKAAWLTSRESYGQTEVFRLSNGPIDAEEGWVADKYGALEGQLNAWPLDENMIDYTLDDKGATTSGNIIDTKGSFNPGGEESKVIDVTNISIDAITQLNENGGEANVATGYHAIEFLLWGQDQDYSNFVKDGVTNGPLSAGQRPLSDFTSDVNSDRRLAYLKVAAAKIVADLEVVTGAWDKKAGEYRKAFLGLGKNAIKKEDALKDVFAGMGVFMKSELANERIAVAVLTPSEEDEHSCFSDNTHRDIATNYQGFKNVLMGTYNGKYYGKAPIDALDKETKNKAMTLMSSVEKKIALVDATARTSRHFDYQIRPDDANARVIVKMKNEMRKLGDIMVDVAKANGINLTTDDVTDAEETQL